MLTKVKNNVNFSKFTHTKDNLLSKQVSPYGSILILIVFLDSFSLPTHVLVGCSMSLVTVDYSCIAFNDRIGKTGKNHYLVSIWPPNG